MDIIFQNETIKLNQQPTVEDTIKTINNLMGDDYYFSHLVVDDIEVYEEPEFYLSEHASQINKLEVIAKKVHEFVNDILLTSMEYINNAKPEIVSLSEEFYQNPTSDSWNRFTQMLEGFQWLNEMIMTIDKTKRHPGNWFEYIRLAVNLQEELKDIEEALENNDSILIADLVKYEVLPIYDSLKVEIQTTIDTEGYYHDIS